jgi:hypothetical protein
MSKIFKKILHDDTFLNNNNDKVFLIYLNIPEPSQKYFIEYKKKKSINTKSKIYKSIYFF